LPVDKTNVAFDSTLQLGRASLASGSGGRLLGARRSLGSVRDHRPLATIVIRDSYPLAWQ